jgi:hypothetical protein
MVGARISAETVGALRRLVEDARLEVQVAVFLLSFQIFFHIVGDFLVMMLPFHALGPCIHKGSQRMIGPKRKEVLFHVSQPLLARISNITVNERVSPPIKHEDPVRHQSRNPSGLFERRRRLGRGSSMQVLRRWE